MFIYGAVAELGSLARRQEDPLVLRTDQWQTRQYGAQAPLTTGIYAPIAQLSPALHAGSGETQIHEEPRFASHSVRTALQDVEQRCAFCWLLAVALNLRRLTEANAGAINKTFHLSLRDTSSPFSSWKWQRTLHLDFNEDAVLSSARVHYEPEDKQVPYGVFSRPGMIQSIHLLLAATDIFKEVSFPNQ
jgi:hypothetical protein